MVAVVVVPAIAVPIVATAVPSARRVVRPHLIDLVNNAHERGTPLASRVVA